MRLLTRARAKARRLPKGSRAAEFDQAVAEFFMRIALEEGQKALGRTAPNPAVGAILVKGGRVISRGFTRPAGQAHAEIVAIEAAGARARGADLYSTLEPCNHHGRTPPCTDAILEAGVRRVIYASSDPNPLVNGRGVRRLVAAGVEVRGGVLAGEADQVHRPFFKHIRTGLPFVVLKAAVTLDGKLATASGDSRWVTGEAARLFVHHLRDRVDAIMVGANTVERDDPRLTTRLPGGGGRDPLRVVVDSRLRCSPRRKVFTQRSSARTVVATLEKAASARARRLAATGAEVWTLPGRAGKVDLHALLKRLGREGMLSVMVEGGAQLFAGFLRRQLADELMLFIAPKLIGHGGLSWTGELGVKQMAKALALRPPRVEPIGDDLLLTSDLKLS